ncbi:MAG: hypothetical protein Q8Q95_03660 [bacterium]|nr:hypothetical protein [bacterium]
MSRGKWYFTYIYRDTFGGGLAGTTEHEEIPLNAITEDEAIIEAKVMLDKKVVAAKAYWEKQRKEWVNPPATPFEDGPINPYVVYKIPLQCPD